MNVEQERRFNQLLEQAIDQPTAERRAFAEKACKDDPAMLQSLLTFLALETEAVRWMPDRNAELKPGQSLGPWHLERPLGRGGMGSVWVVLREQPFQMTAALKVVQRERVNAETTQRFLRERQILADLNHPNICRLLDGGTTDDERPYLVMEYIEGDTLRHWFNTHEVSLKRTLSLFQQACSALAYAHQKGILHRDIKPTNIMIDSEGTLKLLDFGIAGFQKDQQESLTRMEPFTPDYASPERLAGERATAAADIYSMGLVLLEMCTGKCPTASDLGEACLQEWTAKKPAERKPVQALIQRLLATHPESRPASAKALTEEVDTLIKDMQMQGAQPHRLPALAALLLTGLLAILAYSSLAPSQPAETTPLNHVSHPTANQPSVTRTEPLFQRPGCRILIMPFRLWEDCTIKNVRFEAALQDRLRHMSDKHQLDLNVVFLEEGVKPANLEEAKQLGHDHKADLVIWGDLFEQCNSLHETRLKYTMVTTESNEGETQMATIKLSSLLAGELKREIQEITYRTVGLRAYQDRKYAQAVEILQKLDTDDSLILYPLGTSLLRLNRRAEGEKVLRRSLKNAPSLLNLGLHYQALRDFAGAADAYSKAIAEKPTSTLYHNRGNCNWVLGKHDEALADLGKALELTPTNFRALLYRSVVYMDLEQYDRAMVDLNHLIELRPKLASAYSNRGAIYLKRGRYKQAQEDLTQAIGLRENYGIALYNSACAYALEGQPQRAIKRLEQAFATGAEHLHKLAKTDTDLDSLRDLPNFQQLMGSYY